MSCRGHSSRVRESGCVFLGGPGCTALPSAQHPARVRWQAAHTPQMPREGPSTPRGTGEKAYGGIFNPRSVGSYLFSFAARKCLQFPAKVRTTQPISKHGGQASKNTSRLTSEVSAALRPGFWGVGWGRSPVQVSFRPEPGAQCEHQVVLKERGNLEDGGPVRTAGGAGSQGMCPHPISGLPSRGAETLACDNATRRCAPRGGRPLAAGACSGPLHVSGTLSVQSQQRCAPPTT